ncbi:hypothetical protein ASG89_26115 [Paenibacillus sp. Soil766]|uniref:DNA sulfur modification protein DndD n=1 Tax=Paenibacillus sp. Soil766 TaxID=1736404 RepID=UPI000708A6F5|nr:DNA sulfur modification protein DndD [Paenibacillus sp. Soil766]KRF01086.1 hypothetical protein ASG89_26115 [Paenibacillus sp. Soil766]
MKFNRLRITNIGAFHGNYDFDLKTERNQKNIILFGGKNGAGKTTILESVKLALFGPLAYGYKTESTPYFDKILVKLNNNARKNKETKYHIILDIEMVENYQKNVYTLRRSWIPTKTAVKEEFIVLKNRVELSSLDKDLFQNKLREETPPQLLDLCLFDGERIAQVISEEVLSDHLKETAKVMFNLDLFENLENDLNFYIKQEDIHNSLSREQQHLLEQEEELEKLLLRLDDVSQQLAETDSELEEKHQLSRELIHNYETNGGLMKDQRESLLQKINEIELQRRVMMDRSRDIISSLLPFALVKDQLNVIQNQMQEEIKHELIENMETLFNPHGFAQVLNQLQKKGALSLVDSRENVAIQLHKEILDIFSLELPKHIYRASSAQKAEITSIYHQVNEFDGNFIIESFKENTDLIKKSQNLRKKISENDETSELHELLKQLGDTQSSITSLEHNKNQLSVIYDELSEEISERKHVITGVREKQMQTKKSENIFVISTRIAEVSRHFRSIQLKKKLQQVEMEAAKMLRLLFRKELFVVRVWIHPETFQLKLYNSLNEEILKENLSAGEKQILLLSTIWAMAMCSNRRLPFIFDTLLGRLDQTHKKSIIEHFLPRCGEQAIILSTDSEIDSEHYKLVQPIVSKTYTLDFNTDESTVQISNNYFHFQLEEEDISYAVSTQDF